MDLESMADQLRVPYTAKIIQHGEPQAFWCKQEMRMGQCAIFPMGTRPGRLGLREIHGKPEAVRLTRWSFTSLPIFHVQVQAIQNIGLSFASMEPPCMTSIRLSTFKNLK